MIILMDSNAEAHMTPMEIRDSIAVHTYGDMYERWGQFEVAGK